MASSSRVTSSSCSAYVPRSLTANGASVVRRCSSAWRRPGTGSRTAEASAARSSRPADPARRDDLFAPLRTPYGRRRPWAAARPAPGARGGARIPQALAVGGAIVRRTANGDVLGQRPVDLLHAVVIGVDEADI